MDDPVIKLPKIGPMTSNELNRNSIYTVGELAKASPDLNISNIESHIKRAKEYLGEDKEVKTEFHHRYIIEDHTWFEKKVCIPCKDGKMRDVIIYDLTLEPGNRIGLICNWVLDDLEVSDSFTPQYIFHFNVDVLPILQVNMRKDDLESLESGVKESFFNILFEVNTMKKVQDVQLFSDL